MARKTTKLSIKFDTKYLGQEPIPEVWPYDNFVEQSRIFNWYNYFHNIDDIKSFIYMWMKSCKYKAAQISNAKKLDLPRKYGVYARCIMNGVKFNDDNIVNEMHKAVSVRAKVNNDSEAEPIVKKKKAGPTVYELSLRKARDFIAVVDDNIDRIYEDDVIDSIAKLYDKYDIKPKVADYVIEHYKPLIEELNSRDPQVKEAYKHMSPTVKRRMIKYIEELNTQSERVAVINSATKNKKKQESPLTKQIRKLKYLPMSDSLGIASVLPTKLVGAQYVWLYDTKYKKLWLVKSSCTSGISVKGTTLKNIDPDLTVGKTCSNVDKIKEAANSTKSSMKAKKNGIMKSIRSKELKFAGRMNQHVLILKVF